MRKLNNKGFTVIELILSFIFVMILALSMFGLLTSYKNKSQIESIKADIVTYKNDITANIQKDINAKILRRAEYCNSGAHPVKSCVMLYFNDNTSARLSVETGSYTDEYGENYESNYISYNGIRYDTKEPAFTMISKKDLLLTADSSTFIEKGINLYRIIIPITHTDLDEEYEIRIVANGYDYTYGVPELPKAPTIKAEDPDGNAYASGTNTTKQIGFRLTGATFNYGSVDYTEYCLFEGVDGDVSSCSWQKYTGRVSLTAKKTYYVYGRTRGTYNGNVLYSKPTSKFIIIMT